MLTNRFVYKKLISILITASVVLIIIDTFAPAPLFFLIFINLIGLSIGGLFLEIFLLAFDTILSFERSIYCTVLPLGICFGKITTGLLGYLVSSWRVLGFIGIFFLLLTFIFHVIWIYDSPRFTACARG